jgi:hypothetical protein
MAEPIEQASEWVRSLATPAEELAAMRAEALAEIAKCRRGEPSWVMTFEETFAWLDALDAADEDAGGTGSHAGDLGPRGHKEG